ncbi:MAG: MaoC family dehydratase N-terminal domain-containing protein [Actinomycetes bacterium]
MAVNADFVGRVYPPDDVYEVGREKIREFAEALAGADGGAFVADSAGAAQGASGVHPAYVDPEAARALGYPDVIAPPTFAVIVAQRSDARLVRDPEAHIDFSRIVHGDQRFRHHRPIVAGDRLVATLHVDSVRSMGGHSMVTTRSEIATEAGEAVCTATSTLVVRGEEG